MTSSETAAIPEVTDYFLIMLCSNNGFIFHTSEILPHYRARDCLWPREVLQFW